MSGKTLVVYPLPPVLLNNPYLDQLYAPMSDSGVVVRRGRPRVELLRLLFGGGPRILHLHFFDELTQRPSKLSTALRSMSFVLLLVLLKWRGVRLVWTAHNLAPHETYHPFWSFVVYRIVARWSSVVIAHSSAARDMLESRYGMLPQAVVIPHGSYIGLYGPPRDRAESRAALGLPAHGPVLLNFGSLRPYKQIETLIDAFARLPVETRGTLLIVGSAKSPEYAAVLQRHASGVPGVELRLMFIPDAELPTYLAASDAVVLPYRSLLTSGVLLWALSYERPVVAPAFGPVRELVRDAAEGFLFTPGDVASLEQALARLLAVAQRSELEAAALERAREFDWLRIAARTADVYWHVVAES